MNFVNKFSKIFAHKKEEKSVVSFGRQFFLSTLPPHANK